MVSNPNRVIFHVDMDSFYASCELARTPEFKDTPFIVGADPKEGQGRGVVLACNYLARKLGVRSGLPISRAWELCPEGKYVYPDHKLYGEVSGRVMSIVRNFSSKVEQVSIDEAYLDVTEQVEKEVSTGANRKDAIVKLVNSIKAKVTQAEKITCSVGIANSKIVAKIATDMNKPDGFTLVEPSGVIAFLAPLPVEKIPGVGKVTQKMLLDRFNITKIGELDKFPIDGLRDQLGRSAVWLKNVAQGIDESEVVSYWEPVSQSSETTFEEDEEDFAVVRKVMIDVAKEVHSRTIQDGYLFRNIGIKIRFSGFETHTRSRMLPAQSESLEVVNRECSKLLSEFQGSGRKVRLIGVKLSELEKKSKDQMTLQEWT